VIGFFPDWYAAPQPDWPPQTRLTGFPCFDEGSDEVLPQEVEEYLRQGEAPLVFMPGSLMQGAEHFFAESVGACLKLGRRGILLTRFAHQLPGELPEEVRHFDYVPFSLLLPRAAALVHHGGIGTASQALRAGVPQLIHPLAFDQHDNAARLRRLGVGDRIDPSRFRAPAVAERLESLLTAPSVAERCREIAGRFGDTRPLTLASKLIEAMLDG